MVSTLVTAAAGVDEVSGAAPRDVCCDGPCDATADVGWAIAGATSTVDKVGANGLADGVG